MSRVMKIVIFVCCFCLFLLFLFVFVSGRKRNPVPVNLPCLDVVVFNVHFVWGPCSSFCVGTRQRFPYLASWLGALFRAVWVKSLLYHLLICFPICFPGNHQLHFLNCITWFEASISLLLETTLPLFFFLLHLQTAVGEDNSLLPPPAQYIPLQYNLIGICAVRY